MKRILVTGASGFIGRQCLAPLEARNYEIHAISTKEIQCQNNSVIWHRLDLFDFSAVSKLISELSCTHLLHLAWTTEHGKFWSSLHNYEWVHASMHLAKCFSEFGGRRIICAGSCIEYEPGTTYHESNGRFLPKSLYGASKRALYLMLSSFAKQIGIEFAWGYLFYLYGPNEHPDRFIPAIIRGLLKKEEIACSHGQQMRDFLHSRDAGKAFAALVDSQVTGGINIASGHGISLREIGLFLANKMNGEHLLKFGKLQPSDLDSVDIVANASRVLQELNWRPEISLECGLEEVVKWWEELYLFKLF